MELEEAILNLVKGNDQEPEKKASYDASVTDELDKLASLEEMPEDVSELLRNASDIIKQQRRELEYSKLAYEMAKTGSICYEDIPSKIEELKGGNADPILIKEAMRLGTVSNMETFGEASSSSDETATSGMYSVLTN